MAKKRKKPIFNESGSDSDGAGCSFKEYLNERSAQSRKKAKSSTAIIAAAASLDPDGEVNSPRARNLKPDSASGESNLITNLLKSKNQRELDKLHLQSVKNSLEIELEGSNLSKDEAFITEGYKKKREEFDRADLLAEEESRQEHREEEDPLNTNSGSVALRLLMTGKPNARPNLDRSSISSADKERTSGSKFENDIYRIRQSETVEEAKEPRYQGFEDLLNLDPKQKKMCIQEFLKSTKAPEDIELQVRKYKERHNL